MDSCLVFNEENQQIRHFFANDYVADYALLGPGDEPKGEHVLYVLYGPRAYVDKLLYENRKKYTPREQHEYVYAFYIRYLLKNDFYSLTHRGATLTEALAPLREVGK